MEITATLVKELRERTGAGMMECKKALVEAEGDIEKAIENMRKSGAAKAAKKASRIASEGMVFVSETQNGVVLVEVNCETDFVARSDDFIGFTKHVAEKALEQQSSDVTAVTDAEGKAIEKQREALIAKLGENISVRRIHYQTKQGSIATYLHGQRIGVIVEIDQDDVELAKDLAMHIAATQPLVVAPDDVPADHIEKEKDIFRAQAKESGKPDDIVEKMITGRIKKYLNEVSLLGQPFVKNPDMTVDELVKSKNATILNFTRYEVGEGIEKKQDDFVAEVMAQARGD